MHLHQMEIAPPVVGFHQRKREYQLEELQELGTVSQSVPAEHRPEGSRTVACCLATMALEGDSGKTMKIQELPSSVDLRSAGRRCVVVAAVVAVVAAVGFPN